MCSDLVRAGEGQTLAQAIRLGHMQRGSSVTGTAAHTLQQLATMWKCKVKQRIIRKKLLCTIHIILCYTHCGLQYQNFDLYFLSKGFLLLLFSSTLLLFQPTHSAPIPNPEPLSPGLIIGAKAGALLVLKGKSWDSRASRSILKLCYSNPLVPVSLW